MEEGEEMFFFLSLTHSFLLPLSFHLLPPQATSVMQGIKRCLQCLSTNERGKLFLGGSSFWALSLTVFIAD